MLSKDLEDALQSSFLEAREECQKYVTVEHLLLALLAEASATRILKATGANLVELRCGLEEFISETPRLEHDEQTMPTMGFQRTLQRAVFRVQANGHKEVGGGNVLVSIFGEPETTAVALLRLQNTTRQDVIDHLVRTGDSSVTSVVSRDARLAAGFIGRGYRAGDEVAPGSETGISRSQFRIGDWIVEPPRNRIRRGSNVVRLRPRVMEVLVHLAREPSAVVGIAELVERLWPRLESGRDAVHRAITELRRALGDDAKHPTYIETIPKRGYRLMRPVGG